MCGVEVVRQQLVIDQAEHLLSLGRLVPQPSLVSDRYKQLDLGYDVVRCEPGRRLAWQK